MQAPVSPEPSAPEPASAGPASMTRPTVDKPLGPPEHSAAFKFRRFLNWFPMGLSYAMLYMGRYNLTVGKNALGDLMTKEDFSIIFSAGTVVYALAFLLNGPLTDKIGGKKALLISTIGAGIMNLVMGFYLQSVVGDGSVTNDQLRLMFSLLYAGNMYFQSFGAVAIVKVNAHWFHVRERGSFSGIFGTMISSGLFFAFTVNEALLAFFSSRVAPSERVLQTRWVFFIPAIVLLVLAAIESVLLKDKPSEAGLKDFDTGDGSSEAQAKEPVLALMKRILTHPIILTVALIEFCTGVLRNGVMHWYPIFVKEVQVLPPGHWLTSGTLLSEGGWLRASPFFVVGAALFAGGYFTKGRVRGALISAAGVSVLLPFLGGGWGGILMVAGVLGGNVAGFISDLFFGSRRAPAAGGLYVVLFLCTLGMVGSLGASTNVLAESKVAELKAGDKLVSVAGQPVEDWVSARKAFVCVPAACSQGAQWDAALCLCSGKPQASAVTLPEQRGSIAVEVERDGARQTIAVPDPAYKHEGEQSVAKLRAGDSRDFKVQPMLTVSPYVLGVVVFLISLCVIGTHGLLSGTATMDFGGKQGAATAVAMIDGFVYLGTALQSLALGKITSQNWAYWPWFLMPFAVVGFLLTLRIWNAKPSSSGGH